MLAFLRKHLLEAVLLAALTGAAAGWLKGLVSGLLPGTEAPRCWVEEHWKAAVSGVPRPDPARFTVLVARLNRDPDGSQTANVVDAFLGQRGFRSLTTCRVVARHGDDQIAAEERAEAEAERLRIARGADLILWGEVADRGALRIWMTGPTVFPDLKARPWTVDKGLLEPAFQGRFAAALQAITLAALAPAAEQSEGHAVADLLRPLLPRLHHLVADLPSGLIPDAKGALLFSAAWGFQIYGEQAGDSAVLEEAVTAYHAALEEYTQARVPLDWAMTQNNLGNALLRLGERESGTARLEEAVVAYRAALEERTRAQVPLDWAMTQNNLGNALLRLGERESGTARLEEAVAAYRAALEEYTRARVPLYWAMTQNNLGNALAALGERESGTARLEEAVAAFRAALEERTRARVPLDWAYSQHGLAETMAMLAMRLKDPSRMQEALTCMRGAAEVYRQAGDNYWRPVAEKRVTELEAQLAKMNP
ncbi:MAG TPA: tetratricopeptide repeat protein [Stellaceae bacterium]|nr:tetratricopeptide repeat protein [Stellaceae bacterium]